MTDRQNLIVGELPQETVDALRDSVHAPRAQQWVVTDEMVELGARALWKISTYHGYNDETLEREWLRMASMWRNQAKAVLLAVTSTDATPGAQWQPIDTCDRSLFGNVLVVEQGIVSEAYYNGESDSWWLANTAEHDFDHAAPIYPTHWMRLPEPPSVTSTEPCPKWP